jgi:hypothetical protein
MKDRYDRVLASQPVDKTAAMAFAKGEHYEPDTKIDCEHWDTAPPLPVRPHNVEDLTGIQFGRLTVVGWYAPAAGSDKGTKWLVRCACGDFEVRRAKVIKRPGPGFHSCRKCGFQKHVKARAFFESKGRWPSDEEATRKGMW